MTPRWTWPLGLLGVLLWSSVGHAWDDPTWRLAEHHLRELRAAGPLGAMAGDDSSLAWSLRDAGACGEGGACARSMALAAVLGPILSSHEGDGVDWSRPEAGLRWGAGLSLGDRQPALNSGDTEPGALSLRGSLEAWAWLGRLEAVAEPELGLDLGGEGGGTSLPLRRAWLGWHGPGLMVGVGLQPRRLGPGRQDSLMLSDNARPVPMGTVAGSRRLWGLGVLRGEVGVGWLDGRRSDVADPKLILMDLRYSPVPEVELGATRLGIFGGRGRPSPPLGQLLLPTDPHVYDDPDQLEPDQDELASLDARLTLPMGRWLPGLASGGDGVGLDRIELWWQYGAEDLVTRRLAGLPYPSLAGVANLGGLEVAGGDWALQLEGSRILDDYFRWYTGHRIYHDGFTRDGLPMGHSDGGDSLGWGLRLLWLPGAQGGEVWVGTARRVGVIEATGPNLLALMADERRLRAGLGLWTLDRREGDWPGWFQARVEVEHADNLDFVTGQQEWTWRVALAR